MVGVISHCLWVSLSLPREHTCPTAKKKLREKKKKQKERENSRIQFTFPITNQIENTLLMPQSAPRVGRFQNNASKEGIVFARWKRILGQVASDAAEDDLRSHELRAGNGDASRLNSAAGAGKGRGHAAGRGTPSTSFVLGSPC